MSIVSTPPFVMFSCRQQVLTAPMVGCKGLTFYGLPLFIIKKGVVNDLDTPIGCCSYYQINNMKNCEHNAFSWSRRDHPCRS